MAVTHFTERQYVFKTWVGKLTFMILIVLILALYYFYFVQDNSLNLFSVCIQCISFLAVFMILFSSLKATYTNQNITLQYFPYHFKKINYSKVEIDALEIVNYNGLGDFGGWGIRINNEIKCFSVSGNCGVLITLKNGKQRLIGTKETETIKKLLVENGYNVADKSHESLQI
jgi:predicted membrane protein